MSFMVSTPAFAQHAGDIFVGRSSTNQLKIGPPGSGSFSPSTIKVLPPVNSLFVGWSDNNPGFDHIVTDQPALDFYALQSGCSVRLQVVQSDPAFSAITSSFQVLNQPGQSALLGNNTLHVHLTWLIDSTDPNYDPRRVLYHATYKLVDTGSTGYSASDPFTFNFDACNHGDCNVDGKLDGADIQYFVTFLLNPGALNSIQLCSADMNGDGNLTLADLDGFVSALLAG